jgi:hypothetical protein
MATHESQLTEDQAADLQLRAARVFQPRTPIATRDLFAGRWGQITTIADAVGQSGLHVLIYGERGVGKTSLANIVRPVIHVFDEEASGGRPQRIIVKTNANAGDSFSSLWSKLLDEITWQEDRAGIGLIPTGRKAVPLRKAFDLPKALTVDDVRKVLARLPGSVFIIDEFDRASTGSSREFTDLIKGLSDFAVDSTIILVGVSDTVDGLIQDHGSIHRTLAQILLPRMTGDELREILRKAEEALSVHFAEEAASFVIQVAQGLPHYAHLLGLHSVRKAAERRSSEVSRDDVFKALRDAVTQAQQSVTDKYLKATHSAHKDALYRQVLLACALAATLSNDALGYFNPASVVEPLGSILVRDVQIATFSNHLSELCHPKRGQVLERTGQPRSYRFRFRDPLLVPYIFMDAVHAGLVTDSDLSEILGGQL